MDNENEDALDGESNSVNDFHQEDIPLWLQGIEEAQDEDASSLKKEDDVTDQWIKEVPEYIGDTQKSLNISEDSQQEGEDLPNWIGEEPENPSKEPSDLDDAKSLVNELEEPNIDPEDNAPIESETFVSHMNENFDPDEISEKFQDAEKKLPPEEVFIEISEADILDEDQSNQDVRSSEDEELPYWLQEMIAEPSQNESAEEQPAPGEIEEFLEEENELEGDLVEEIIIEEVLPSQDSPQEVDESQTSNEEIIEQDLTELMAEDNTKPVMIQSETHIGTEIPFLEQEEVVEQIQPLEMPEDLENAKMLLDGGKYSEALHAINNSPEKKAYHDDIRSWLKTSVQEDADGNSEVWEAIGDIEMSEAKTEEALIAYTKAIHALLVSKKETDEFD